MTRLALLRLSSTTCTSASVTSITGERLDFCLQPATRAFSVSGYVSGTVCCFSTSTPTTRASSRERTGMADMPPSYLKLHLPQQAQHADRDEVDRDDEIEQARHDEDEDARDERDEGSQC